MEIVQQQNRLSVRGKLKDANDKTYLHRGIAARSFERQFDLADHVEVTDATMGECPRCGSRRVAVVFQPPPTSQRQFG